MTEPKLRLHQQQMLDAIAKGQVFMVNNPDSGGKSLLLQQLHEERVMFIDVDPHASMLRGANHVLGRDLGAVFFHGEKFGTINVDNSLKQLDDCFKAITMNVQKLTGTFTGLFKDEQLLQHWLWPDRRRDKRFMRRLQSMKKMAHGWRKHRREAKRVRSC